jgi:hypothetical protein
MEVMVQLHNPAALPPGKQPVVMTGKDSGGGSACLPSTHVKITWRLSAHSLVTVSTKLPGP